MAKNAANPPMPSFPGGYSLQEVESDYLAKVRILVENTKATEADAALFRGLSSSALACYQQLDAIPDELPTVMAGVQAP